MSNFLHDIPRHFKEAYHGLLRNIAMTLSSVSAVTVTLVLIAVFTVFAMNISAFTKNMESDTKIHVQIEDVIEESKIPSLQEAVEKIANVSEVTYSDKDAELDAFIEIYGEHGELFESYRGEANPLKRAFIVEVDDGDEIERVTQDITKIPGIESALYGGTNVLAMMDAFNAIRSGGLIFVLCLSALAIFLISNTIKLTITARKDEIAIMRLVGASNGFIRTPFLIEGMFIGLLGALFPILITIFGYGFLYEAFNGVFFSEMFPLIAVDPFVYQVSGLLAFIGVMVGLIGSYISVSRLLWWRR
ncbi:MAG: permease-like cell division protein FtsX [Erysipelotrichales bacterium]|nr:permease-like cell division protein FtsX [Erysipelotrichales bacterium]